MNIFYRPKYLSETTQFINELKARNPQMANGQVEGRALLWNKTLDRDAQSDFGAARVAQQPYVYQTAAK
ncbi:MAG: DUF3460 family protein [Burkholderiales bacterium]|jgi:hypothetical protein|nr:DUF3460 family protein [Burkholderiales bacterium]